MDHRVTIRLSDDLEESLTVRRLIVAGFTGRDPSRHIEELRRFGVEPPRSVPVFFELAPRWVTVEDVVILPSSQCSGEAEPVLLLRSDNIQDALVTVGSDVTDRVMERQSIAIAKEAPKPVSASTWFYPEVAAMWDRLALKSWVDDGPEPYQAGTLDEFLPAEVILEHLCRTIGGSLQDTALFLGTLTLSTHEFRYGDRFRCELTRPDGMTLRCAYRTRIARNWKHPKFIGMGGEGV